MADIGFEGLERFLHMVEGRLGRWGKPIGTAVLLLAVAAFSLFCLNHIVNDGVIPFWDIIKTIKTNPKNTVSIIYQFVSGGGAILLWFVIFPIIIAYIIGLLVATYKHRKTMAEMKRRIELANRVGDAINEYAKNSHEAVASLKTHGDPKDIFVALQKLGAALEKVRPEIDAYQKGVKAADQSSSSATPSKSNAAKQAKKNVA